MKQVRTRFAPSPTGFLHVGNVRAALFPWLVARQNGGKFILRIEDTDQAREVEGAVEVIRTTLGWLGMQWDEGPDIGGDYGPYTQTERVKSYQLCAQKLVDEGLAYADTRSPSELQLLREDAQANKQPFLARNYRPASSTEWKVGMPLRLLSKPKSYTWDDAIMGKLSGGAEAVDDFILIKSDGLPTYNFAHIVDDNAMQITHIIRGIEYISSMPKYLALYEALKFDVPIFAHSPHIMAPDGNKKLSKRDGAKGILAYRDDGFLPEAILNFLASLGWNDGTEQEIFSTDELIAKFRLDHVQRSGARFDEKRLEWMNGSYIRSLEITDLAVRVASFWPIEAHDASSDYKLNVLRLIQERLKYFAEIPGLSMFFFVDLPINAALITTNKQLRKFETRELHGMLTQAREVLAMSDFCEHNLTDVLNGLLVTSGQKPGVLFSLIRIATTQAAASPGLAETLSLLGKERCLSRIDTQLAHLQT
jgi:glutamyl-tRNA synthetase